MGRLIQLIAFAVLVWLVYSWWTGGPHLILPNSQQQTPSASPTPATPSVCAAQRLNSRDFQSKFHQPQTHRPHRFRSCQPTRSRAKSSSPKKPRPSPRPRRRFLRPCNQTPITNKPSPTPKIFANKSASPAIRVPTISPTLPPSGSPPKTKSPEWNPPPSTNPPPSSRPPMIFTKPSRTKAIWKRNDERGKKEVTA